MPYHHYVALLLGLGWLPGKHHQKDAPSTRQPIITVQTPKETDLAAKIRELDDIYKKMAAVNLAFTDKKGNERQSYIAHSQTTWDNLQQQALTIPLPQPKRRKGDTVTHQVPSKSNTLNKEQQYQVLTRITYDITIQQDIRQELIKACSNV